MNEYPIDEVSSDREIISWGVGVNPGAHVRPVNLDHNFIFFTEF